MELSRLRSTVTTRLTQARKAVGGALKKPPVNGSSRTADITFTARQLPSPTVSQIPPPPEPTLVPPAKVETSYAPPSGTTGPLLMESPMQADEKSSEPLTPVEKMLQGIAQQSSEGAVPSNTEGRSRELERLDDRWRADTFNREFKEAGWQVRKDSSDHNFWIHKLEGREVAFYSRDEKGKMAAQRGVIARRDNPGMSARFQLEGGDETFNANQLDTMALKPLEPEPEPDAGKTFRDRYGEAGWKVRDTNAHGEPLLSWDFAPGKLNGLDVAFTTRDDKGQLLEHRGVLKQRADRGFLSTLFSLEGQEGEFNSNFTKDFAVRRPQPTFGTT